MRAAFWRQTGLHVHYCTEFVPIDVVSSRGFLCYQHIRNPLFIQITSERVDPAIQMRISLPYLFPTV
jgi:hypothetical protein